MFGEKEEANEFKGEPHATFSHSFTIIIRRIFNRHNVHSITFGLPNRGSASRSRRNCKVVSSDLRSDTFENDSGQNRLTRTFNR
ncbi:hypothetical protein BT96DRAFT_925588 [Gymnopus androsaceus JB14]|uniref:Uncharacterized protein n=1 Tax=Gymnopus androsaceus JB14 TaxID=1447944 RepID=A0A6A4GZP4_9AGAR|nr:hypothetical protein BT96DRAFT_925588 [Gymnopus androsaceus JB14]